MNFEVTLKYKVKADTADEALRRVARYNSDVCYFKVQQLSVRLRCGPPPEVVETDCTVIPVE